MERTRLVATVAVISAVIGVVFAGCTSAADTHDLASSNRVWDGGSAVALAPQPG